MDKIKTMIYRSNALKQMREKAAREINLEYGCNICSQQLSQLQKENYDGCMFFAYQLSNMTIVARVRMDTFAVELNEIVW